MQRRSGVLSIIGCFTGLWPLKTVTTNDREFHDCSQFWGRLVKARARLDEQDQDWFLPPRPMKDCTLGHALGVVVVGNESVDLKTTPQTALLISDVFTGTSCICIHLPVPTRAWRSQ